MERITNDDGEIKKNIPKIYIGEDRELNSIVFLSQGGYVNSKYIARGNVLMENEFHMTDEAIIHAGCLLCKIDPHAFCSFYQRISSKHMKDLLKVALNQVKEEYSSILNADFNLKKIEPWGCVYWSDRYIINPINMDCVTTSTGFDIDSGTIVGGYRQKRNEDTGEKRGIIFYHNDERPSLGYGVWSAVFTPKNVRENAKLICQSDIDAYQSLLSKVAIEDPHYSALVSGGNSYAQQLNDLDYTINR